MKRVKKRLSRGGFSLLETLITMLILAIMSTMALTGITNALKSRAQALDIANAQTVASTVASAVADQVRYGRIVEVDGDAIVLESSAYGRSRLELDGGRLVARSTAAGTAYQLLGEKAYGGLVLDELAFTPVMDGEEVKSVRVELSVGAAGSAGALWSLNYDVAPLNPRLVGA